MPLDSDVRGGDENLHVEFYVYKAQGDSDKQWNDKPFVRIMVPGDKTLVHDQPVREMDKRRFPRQWLYFQMKNSESDDFIGGTPLEIWHGERPLEISTAQMDELRILKFRTVEQLAQTADAQL